MTEKEFRALLAIEGKKLNLETHKDDWGRRWWMPSIIGEHTMWVPIITMGYTTKSNAVRATITAYYKDADNR